MAIPCAAVAEDDYDLQVSSETSTDGVITLTWTAPAGTAVNLQQSTSEDFSQAQTLYQGTDEGTTLTGLPDGAYHFRIGGTTNNTDVRWSKTVSVTVAHHSLTRAFIFFGVGVVVFIATLGLVVSGSRRYGRSGR